jgi:phosphoribosyl 1,2-cyclic phosphodiesterase
VITYSLQSGSNGNAIYVETADCRLLFDCGLTGKKTAERMEVHGRHPRDLTAVVVSHDHRDHIKGVGVLARRWKIPVCATGVTGGLLTRKGTGHIPDLRTFESGETLLFHGTRVETIPTPHDGVDGVAFVVESDGERLGIFTDVGYPFDAMRKALASVDAAYVESNYDVHMLETGTYAPDLKERIRGAGGHLSNVEAAELALEALNGRLRLVILSHLSQENNAPDTALETFRKILPDGTPLGLAPRFGTSDLFEVRRDASTG